ncbi:MAG TPA: type II toxin-antitoxin system VapC family toxin [Thermoanaerobaculia bacterium]
MRLLLDTHVLLWWVTGDRRLPKSLARAIESADADVAVSAASLWEIAIKRALGRIDIDLEELIASIAADGFSELPLRFAHARALAELERLHEDPFDRMLIVQSIHEGRRLVTQDAAILSYAGMAGFDPLPR